MQEDFVYIKGFSVILCCYNSEDRIRDTLRHLLKQKTSPFVQWEIIVVNNASKDETEIIAKTFLTKSAGLIPFSIIYEPVPGLSLARKAGMSVAKYSYFLFCDDDNYLDENYIENASAILYKDKSVAALGGIGNPVYDGFIPLPWFLNFAGYLATGPQGLVEGVTPKGCLYGAGLIINRIYFDRLVQLGFKNVLLDRKGESLSSGGDTELTKALGLIGGKLIYSPRLVFDHLIPYSRTQWVYLEKLAYHIGVCDFIVSSYEKKSVNFFSINAKNLMLLLIACRRAILCGFLAGKKESINYQRMKGRFIGSLLFFSRYKKGKVIASLLTEQFCIQGKDYSDK